MSDNSDKDIIPMGKAIAIILSVVVLAVIFIGGGVLLGVKLIQGNNSVAKQTNNSVTNQSGITNSSENATNGSDDTTSVLNTPDATLDLVFDYMSKADYEAAMLLVEEENLDDFLKRDIKRENVVAYLCSTVYGTLKNPSSFELRNAWYADTLFASSAETYGGVVLQVAGTNSYGGIVSNYWYYSYDYETGKYSLGIASDDLAIESSNSWDDIDEILEKTERNLLRLNASEVMYSDKNKLSEVNISAINLLFKKDLLKYVKLLED